MMTALTPSRSLTELLHRVGDVPAQRIIRDPAPGTATIADALRLCDGEPKRLCELIDGVLVEQTMGARESRIALWLGYLLHAYLQDHPLGILSGEAGPYHLLEDQVRFPDVAFVSWNRIPVDADPRIFAPEWVPNLAVEVLSLSNTRGEMQRKLEDYFTAGVELVWYVDPDTQTIEVFTGVEQKQVLHKSDTLTGGTVLPGFQVDVKELFESGELRRPNQ